MSTTKKKQRKIDWDAIKTEYITSDISLKGLEKKYRLSHGDTTKHSSSEGWVSLRKDYRQRTVSKAVTKSCNKRANELAGVLDAAFNIRDTIISAAKDPVQFNRYLVQYGSGKDFDTEERVYDKLDTKAIKEMTQALKNIEDLIRSIGNNPTEAEAQRLRIEREKWEREKAAASKTENNDHLGVILIPEIGEQ
jgi:hypothetical protein